MTQTKLSIIERSMATIAPWSINWDNICYTRILNESFIRKFVHRVNWPIISYWQKLSQDFIREFSDRVDWNMISLSQGLSESFILEFADKINWYGISESQRLSEAFIREFADKLNWQDISTYQILSESFIREFADKVDWWMIIENQHCMTKRSISEFIDRIDWDNVAVYHAFSDTIFVNNFAIMIGKSTNYVKRHLKDAETKYKCIFDKFVFCHRDLIDRSKDLFHQEMQIDMMIQELPLRAHTLMIQEMMLIAN